MQHNQNYRKEIEEGEKEKRLKEYNRLRFSKVFFSFLLLPINQSILILQLTQLSVFFYLSSFFLSVKMYNSICFSSAVVASS